MAKSNPRGTKQACSGDPGKDGEPLTTLSQACGSCGRRLRGADRADRIYCSGRCRMRALRARSGKPDAGLQDLAASIERFLGGRILRNASVDTRAPAELVDEDIEVILTIAVDTRDRVLRSQKSDK